MPLVFLLWLAVFLPVFQLISAVFELILLLVLFRVAFVLLLCRCPASIRRFGRFCIHLPIIAGHWIGYLLPPILACFSLLRCGHVSAMFRPSSICYSLHYSTKFPTQFSPVFQLISATFQMIFFSLLFSFLLFNGQLSASNAFYRPCWGDFHHRKKKRDLGRVPKWIFRPFWLLFIIIIVIVIIILFFSRLLIHFESLFLPWFPFGSVDVRRFS